jgi:hypothetical protein
MRINSLEVGIFEFTPAVAVTRGHRNYEDEEEGSEEEEPEEEEPEEGDEEDEPKEMLWRSSTTCDYDGTARTRAKGGFRASLLILRRGEPRTIVSNNLVTTAERNKDG